MEEIIIRYLSPHGRQEETKYRRDDKKIELIMRAAMKVNLSNLSECTNLLTLNLANNMLEELDLSPLSGNKTLVEIRLEDNHLPALNLWPLVSCPELRRLNLTRNRLHALDVTPVLVRSQVQLDSSVVMSSDSITRYLLTTNQLADRLLLVRPDRVSWTAPPVLMWTSYKTLAKKMGWAAIRERIVTVLNQITEIDWYAVQRGLLIGFGMEELAGFDGNPSELLADTTGSMDYKSARRSIYDRAVELLDDQISNGGPTLFLDIEEMKETRASKLIAKIVEARRNEIENTTVLTKGSISLMNSLWLTHYGYKILEALGVGMKHFGVEIEMVQQSFDELGFSLKTREVESIEAVDIKEPIVSSQSMKNFVFNQIEKAYL